MTSGNSSLPPIMYYALPAESPLQLIANPGRTGCLSVRAGVVTRNCIFHDLIWPVNLSARTVAFDLRGHAKAGRLLFFRNASSNPPCDRSRQQTFKITISRGERLEKSWYFFDGINRNATKTASPPRKSVFECDQIIGSRL